MSTSLMDFYDAAIIALAIYIIYKISTFQSKYFLVKQNTILVKILILTHNTTKKKFSIIVLIWLDSMIAIFLHLLKKQHDF